MLSQQFLVYVSIYYVSAISFLLFRLMENQKGRIVSVIKVKFLLQREKDGEDKMYLKHLKLSLKTFFSFLLFLLFVIKSILRAVRNHLLYC